MRDRLETLMFLQDNLNARFNLSRSVWTDGSRTEEERMNQCRRFLEALVIESGEALVEAQAKWWKSKAVEYPKLKEELIDCLHFLLSAMLTVGMDAEEVFNTYVQKNSKNHTRGDWDVNQGEVVPPRTSRGEDPS